MTREEYLTQYAEGWCTGDINKLLDATDPGYMIHDPKAGDMDADAFRAFFPNLKALRSEQPFMELSELVTGVTGDGRLTAWCWWAIPEGPEGTCLIKVGEDGVLSEHMTYFVE